MEREKERREGSGKWACSHLKLWLQWALQLHGRQVGAGLRSPWIHYKTLYKKYLIIHCVMYVGIVSLTEEITVFW